MKKEHIFRAGDGERIGVTSYGNLAGDHPRCIIYVHGFKGFKDWGFVPYIGQYLAGRGFFVLTFNFSHNGIGDNPLDFTELDRFAANTLSREVRELSELIDAFRDGFFGAAVNPGLGILGHSRGGGIALLTTPRKTGIGATVTWSSVSTFNRYSEEHKRQWREDGYLEVINQRTGQIMRLGVGLLDDFETHKDDLLDIEKAVKRSGRPLMVVHGEEDESVPVDEAGRIFEWADKDRAELLLVPGTGHTFGARHPFDGTNEKLDHVLDRTAAFFDRFL